MKASSQGGAGVQIPCTLPLDPPWHHFFGLQSDCCKAWAKGQQGFSRVQSLAWLESLILLIRRPQYGVKISHWKRIKCFHSTLSWRNLKTQQSPAILDLCLKKTQSRKLRDKSHGYRGVSVLLKLRVQNEEAMVSNSSDRVEGRFWKIPFLWLINCGR